MKNIVTLDLNTYEYYKELEKELKEAKLLLNKKIVLKTKNEFFGYERTLEIYTDDEAMKKMTLALDKTSEELKEVKVTLEELNNSFIIKFLKLIKIL